ncbi:MAG TPA: GNAT family N-acetyltransferase [Trebonia sp.]|nr:GNAT family N-acetyltransferase [Trebonia sp.]
MRIERWDPADEKTARACHEITVAAQRVDDPVEPPISPGVFGYFFREGWDGSPGETWVASGDDGAVAGYYRISFPDLENLDRASGGPIVHPAFRRRGIGRELLRHAGERAAAHGRTLFAADAATGSAGAAFAGAVGARLDLEEVRRIQYLREIPPGTVAALRATAEKAAAGYSLVSWAGDIPDEYRGPVAGVLNAFADAPHGENEEPEIWDADRVRERAGLLVRAGVQRSHNVAAFCDSTGEMTAWTEVTVDPEVPEWGYQQLTAVVRAHRGHRLGLLVKTAMLELLASAEPRLEVIQTGNAAVNQYMIAVNEQLGYRVVEPGWRHYEMPVADMR